MNSILKNLKQNIGSLILPYQNKFPINVLVAFTGFLDNSFEKYQSKKQVSGYNIFLVK